jgi:adenylate cyclase
LVLERRLVAILAADVVGYSTLMAKDESGTLEALKTHRRDTFDPLVASHGGRTVKLMGDGALVEFNSVVDAAECALAIQQEVAAADGPIRLRIGVNLGDVIVDGEDIYGAGVNIAARLESLAEPGGICVSGAVAEHVQGRIEASLEDMGPQIVKNIPQPLRVFKLARGLSPASHPNVPRPVDKPSIAVLPFDNMSGDPKQEYFSDGVAEDIITALSKYRWFTVTARNSTFTYKGRAVDIRAVGQELNVRYVLEGSVRRAGNRVRVTAQLIDAETSNHVWADHFDGETDDIFALQDEITRRIVSTVAPEIQDAEMASASRKDKAQLSEWERVMRARWLLSRFNREDMNAAEALLRSIIADAPENADAHSLLATCHMYKLVNTWFDDPGEEILAASKAAQKAYSLDPNDAVSLVALGFASLFSRDFEDSLYFLRTAVELNPNMAAAYGIMATTYGCMGECDKSLTAFEQAMSLSPRDPTRLFWMAGIGIGLIIDRRYDEAIDNCRNMLRIEASHGPAHRQLCSALALSGRMDEAHQAMNRLRSLMPELTIAKVERMIPVMHEEHREHWLEGLRIAGLPE